MKLSSIKIIFLLSGVILLFSISSCYYDNEQFLYPNAGVCDTTNTTYTATVQPILQSQCYVCHSGTSPTGGFVLTDYNSVKTYVNNGQLRASITGSGAVPVMPQSGKMSDCNINKVVAWINTGAPNN